LKNRTATLHSGEQQRTAVYNSYCREDQKIAESNEDTNVRRGRLDLRGERAHGTMFVRRKPVTGKRRPSAESRTKELAYRVVTVSKVNVVPTKAIISGCRRGIWKNGNQLREKNPQRRRNIDEDVNS